MKVEFADVPIVDADIACAAICFGVCLLKNGRRERKCQRSDLEVLYLVA